MDYYDKKFGEPSTDVFKFTDFIGLFLDKVIQDIDCPEGTEISPINSKYHFRVERVVATQSFEQAVKLLHKKHRKDVLNQLKNLIMELGNFSITEQRENHSLFKTQDHIDLPIDGGNLVLLYRYYDANTLAIGMPQDSLSQILKLQDTKNEL